MAATISGFYVKDVDAGVVTIRSKKSGRVIDVPGLDRNPGVGLVQWDDNGGINQQWTVLRSHAAEGGKSYFLQSRLNTMVLDAAGASKTSAPIIQWPYHGGLNQQWVFEPAGDGSCFVKNVNSGLVLDIAGGSIENGAKLIQYAKHGGDNQRFYVEELGGGTVSLRSKKSGRVIDVPGSSRAQGEQLIQWERNGGANQQWGVLERRTSTAIPIDWLTGSQPVLLSMMASCQKQREGLSGDWWEGFAKDDVRTHAQAIGQYRAVIYVAFSELSGRGQLWIYNTGSGQNSLRRDVLPPSRPHPCSIQIVDHYMIVAVESAYPSSQDPRPEFSTIAIYDLEPNPMEPALLTQIPQNDCNCGGAGLAYHPRTNRWYILADQDKRIGGGTRLYRSDNADVRSFSMAPIKVYNERFGSGAGINLITATDGSIWALYYEDSKDHMPSHMGWTMLADVVRLWKLVDPDGTPVPSFSEHRKQYTNIGSPQLGDAGLFLNNRPGMRFGASLRNEFGPLELLTCQRNMTATFNIDRVRLESGKTSVMLVNYGAFEAEVYCTTGGTTLHSGHLAVSQSWEATMDNGPINAKIKHNSGFHWVDDWESKTTAPLTLYVVKGLTQDAKVEIHSFTTDYNGKVEVNGHSGTPWDPRTW